MLATILEIILYIRYICNDTLDTLWFCIDKVSSLLIQKSIQLSIARSKKRYIVEISVTRHTRTLTYKHQVIAEVHLEDRLKVI